MGRLKTNFVYGTLTDNPLTAGALTMNSGGLASLPVIASPDTATIVIDPAGTGGAPEVVTVTTHTASATSATITRGAESTVARAHSQGIAWVHAYTAADFGAVPTANTPTQTEDGALVFNLTSDVLTVGTGASRKVIGLIRTAGTDATAINEIVYDTTNKALKVWDGSTSTTFFTPVFKYKSATQGFTADTVFADVTASSGTFSFAVGANEVWHVYYRIPLSFSAGATGGAKFQLTGPAAPTAVSIAPRTVVWDGTLASSLVRSQPVPVTAFSTPFGANNSAVTITGSYEASGNGAWFFAEAIIINGANAGTVTLQAAQNSANGTTTLGIGSFMRADKVA